jgi:hypothetical protein
MIKKTLMTLHSFVAKTNSTTVRNNQLIIVRMILILILALNLTLTQGTLIAIIKLSNNLPKPQLKLNSNPLESFKAVSVVCLTPAPFMKA